MLQSEAAHAHGAEEVASAGTEAATVVVGDPDWEYKGPGSWVCNGFQWPPKKIKAIAKRFESDVSQQLGDFPSILLFISYLGFGQLLNYRGRFVPVRHFREWDSASFHVGFAKAEGETALNCIPRCGNR